MGVWFCGLIDGWVFLLTFWYLTAYLKHLSPLQGYFFSLSTLLRCRSLLWCIYLCVDTKQVKRHHQTISAPAGKGGFCLLLPPANEVWSKVICLQVCVCPQGRGVPAPGGVCSGGCLLPGGCLVEIPPPAATAAGGTHPTGMHFCFILFY